MQKDRKSVVILQPYIPQYRVKFFKELINRASLVGIDIAVAAGEPSGNQARRNDSALPEYANKLRQREFHIFGRRVTVRAIPQMAQKSDLIILEQARRNSDVYRLLLPKWFRRQSIALWGHGADYAGSKGKIDTALRRLLTRQSDWFFAYTAAGVDAVYEQGVPRGRATSVNNSTDTKELRQHLAHLGPPAVKGRELRTDSFRATYIGALDSGKRTDLLIAAGREIAKRLPGFKLLIAGDGASASLVQTAAEEHAWIDYVGAVSGANKAQILASTELLMIPGSIGLVAVDALAAGLPVVTTRENNHGPEFDYLEKDKTVIVTDTSVDAYAEAVVDLLTDRTRLAAMQRDCWDAGEKFSVEKMADNFVTGLQSFFEREETS